MDLQIKREGISITLSEQASSEKMVDFPLTGLLVVSQGRTVKIFDHLVILTLELLPVPVDAGKKRSQAQQAGKHSFQRAAVLAGEALAGEDGIPLGMGIALAFIALRDQIPLDTDLVMMREVALSLEEFEARAEEVVEVEYLRTLVQEQLRTREEVFKTPGNLWNAVRYLLLLGEEAWNLRGDDAFHWGSIPVEGYYLTGLPTSTRSMLFYLTGLMLPDDTDSTPGVRMFALDHCGKNRLSP